MTAQAWRRTSLGTCAPPDADASNRATRADRPHPAHRLHLGGYFPPVGQAPANRAAEFSQTGLPPSPPQHPDPPHRARASGAPRDTGSWPTNRAHGAICRHGHNCYGTLGCANRPAPSADLQPPRRFRPNLLSLAWTCLDRSIVAASALQALNKLAQASMARTRLDTHLLR